MFIDKNAMTEFCQDSPNGNQTKLETRITLMCDNAGKG